MAKMMLNAHHAEDTDTLLPRHTKNGSHIMLHGSQQAPAWSDFLLVQHGFSLAIKPLPRCVCLLPTWPNDRSR